MLQRDYILEVIDDFTSTVTAGFGNALETQSEESLDGVEAAVAELIDFFTEFVKKISATVIFAMFYIHIYVVAVLYLHSEDFRECVCQFLHTNFSITDTIAGVESIQEFDYDAFNSQRFTDAIVDRERTMDISRVLYPNDTTFEGKVMWFMIVNINPGCAFGGSATEYFVGSFDGKEFVPETAPEIAHWLDFGKDHYALVTFHNTGARTIGIPWVSNWQYANVTPFKQTRGMNGLPRDLFLFTKDGTSYVGARPSKEVEALRKEQVSINLPQSIGEEVHLTDALKGLEDSFELDLELAPAAKTTRVGLVLSNELGDELPIYLDLEKERITMDRTKSGLIDFGTKATPHDRESNDWRDRDGVNYQNDFAIATWAPLSLCTGKTYKLRLFVDRSMAELFVQGGRIAMTNLIFPRKPYSTLRLYSEGGATQLHSAKLYRLGL